MMLTTVLDLYSHNKFFGLATTTIIWTILYAAVHILYKPTTRLNTKVILDTKNRIISIIHGVGSFVMAAYVFLFNNFNQPNTNFQSFILIFSLSYCIYDFVACCIFGLADSGLVIHHSLCLFGFSSALYQGYGGIDSLGGLFIAQISNFPMHLRVIIRNYGLRYTKAYELSQNIYLFLYIVFRGVICPLFVLLPSLNSQNSPWVVKLICFSMTLQSFYYIFQMIKIVQKKLAQMREMKDKKVKYDWLKESEDIKKLSFYRATEGPKIF